jgi:large conductance mechanosensitive channel
MKILEEFKKFILKGSVVDLSTGVIIGAAFTGIVSAFSKGIVEPVLALAGGGPRPNLTIPLMNRMVEVTVKDASGQDVTQMVSKLIELDVGGVFGAMISFLITASVVFFLIIKPMNKLRELTSHSEPEPPPGAVPEDIQLLKEIRDLLSKRT